MPERFVINVPLSLNIATTLFCVWPDLRSNPVPRRLDAFIPEIDFGLAAMVAHVNVHGEQDFPAEEASVGRVVRRAQLLFGEVGDDGGAIIEGIS